MSSQAGQIDYFHALAEEEENRPEYFGPAWLLDGLERQCRQICGDGDIDVGLLDPEWMAGQVDVMLCIMIPELRKSLHATGLDVPLYGPNSPEWLAGQCRADRATARDVRETALYRWWDDADLLLYVGIADHLGVRTKGHVKGSSWMEFAARSAVERHPSRIVALRAEEAAIKAEKPLFNYQHNNTPEARRRLVEYLIERDRLDLLAPAISRG
jgi:hypothetical protein